MHLAATSSWEVSSGRGDVYSWTTVWRPSSPAFEVPYVPVIVGIEEGWQVLADLVGCEHDAVPIGMPVEVEFFDHPGGITLPYFHPRLNTVRWRSHFCRYGRARPEGDRGRRFRHQT